MDKSKSSKKNARLKTIESEADTKSITKRLIVFAYAFTFVFLPVNWICRLSVIDPEHWLPAANIARWFLVAVCLYFIIESSIKMILPWAVKFYPSIPPSNKPLSFFIHGFFILLFLVVELVLLVKGNLFVALILTSLNGWINAPHKVKLARKEENLKWRRRKLIDVPVGLFFSAVWITALAFRSLPLALALFVVEVIRELSRLRQSNEMLHHELEKLAARKSRNPLMPTK